MMDIRSDLYGLMRPLSSNIQAREIVELSRPNLKGIHRIGATLICRAESSGLPNARVSLREDTELLIRNSSAGDPAASKEMARILISTYVNSPGFLRDAVNISHAFI